MAEHIQAQAMHQSNVIRDSIKGLNDWVAEMKRKENDFAQVHPKHTNGSQEQRARNADQADERKTPNGPTPQQSKAQRAHDLKERGNAFVKRLEYDKAIRCYTLAIDLHATEPVFYTNRALCYLKKADHRSCIDDCTKAISLEKRSVKAYFRRAMSYEQTCFLKEASADFRSVLEYDAKNVDAKRGLERIDRLQKEQETSREAAKRLRQWSQFVHDPDYDQVAYVNSKPPHLRSKDPLTRITVSESDANAPPTVVETGAAKAQPDAKPANEPIKALGTPNECAIVAPKTTTQFLKAWSTATDPEQKFTILQAISGGNVSKILGAQFNLDMLRDQCAIMEKCFVPRRAPIANLLRGIVQNAEMKIIAFMMVDSDKNRFLKLLQHAREIGENNETIEATLVAFKQLFVL